MSKIGLETRKLWLVEVTVIVVGDDQLPVGLQIAGNF